MLITSNLSSMGVGGTLEEVPQFVNVQLLAHMDGTHGGTTFTDSSSYARAITRPAAGVTTSNTYGKFSQGINPYVQGGYLQVADGSWAAFGNSPWCVECWMWLDTVSGGIACYIYQHGNGGSDYTAFNYNSASGLELLIRNASVNVTYFTTGTSGFAANTWYHVAVTHDGSGTYVIYRDGVSIGTAASSAGRVADYSGGFQIGTNNGGGLFQGRLDEFRVTVGEIVYAGAFTPPTAPFNNF